MRRYKTREEQLRTAGRAQVLTRFPWDAPAAEYELEDQDKAEDVRLGEARFDRDEIHRILSRMMLDE